MRVRASAVWASVLLSVGRGYAADRDFNPYQVPKEVVQKRVHVVALQPINLPGDLKDADDSRSVIEAALTEKLESGGYVVVPPREYAAVWQRTAAQVGGVFDPLTGVADEKKHRVAYDFTARELAERFNVDAVLEAFIMIGEIRPQWVGQAPIPGGRAFMAAGELMTWRGIVVPASADTVPQRIAGPVLNILIRDLQGTLLYSVQAPIEWNCVYLVRSYEERNRFALFADPGRVSQAVAATLKAFVTSATETR